MTDWKFADVYEANAAAVPDRPVPDPGRPRRHVGRARPPGRRAGRRHGRRRPRPPGEGRLLPLQLPRVPRGRRRRVQGRVRARQHELPLRPRRDPLPVRQRRRRGRRLPRHVQPSCSTASATACPASSAGTSSPTRPAPGPDWATPYEDVVTSGRDARPTAGPQRRRPAVPLHRRHDRHAEGRDVAPGRPVQRHRRRRQRAAGRPAGDERGRGRRARAAANPNPPRTIVCCPLMHGTGPVLGVHLDERRRHGHLARRPQVRRRPAVRDRRALAGDQPRHRRPGVRRPDARPPRRQPRPLRPVEHRRRSARRA